jgi:hypothetical protein
MVAVVDDLRRQREQLEKELLLASEAFEREYRPIVSDWRTVLGPVAVSATASSGLITTIYVLFNEGYSAVPVLATSQLNN